jgi:hypothetical protein
LLVTSDNVEPDMHPWRFTLPFRRCMLAASNPGGTMTSPGQKLRDLINAPRFLTDEQLKTKYGS